MPTLLGKAQTLSAEARRLRQGQQGAAEGERVANNINTLSGLIEKAHSAASIHRSYSKRGLVVSTSLSLLDSGRAALATKAATGLPSDQAFVAARRKLESAIAATTNALNSTWQAWCQVHMRAKD